MKLCECGCGKETIFYRGEYRKFCFGHHRRRKKICKNCGLRIWKYTPKNQMYCSTKCRHEYEIKNGLKKTGRNHPNALFKDVKNEDIRKKLMEEHIKNKAKERWLRRKNDPIERLKAKERSDKWHLNKDNKKKCLDKAAEYYKNNKETVLYRSRIKHKLGIMEKDIGKELFKNFIIFERCKQTLINIKRGNSSGINKLINCKKCKKSTISITGMCPKCDDSYRKKHLSYMKEYNKIYWLKLKQEKEKENERNNTIKRCS